MSNHNKIKTCAICQSPVAEEMDYCPNCGLAKPTVALVMLPAETETAERIKAQNENASRLGKEPYSFAYPKVETAYKPQHTNRHTASSKGILYPLLFGFISAIIGGLLLYGIHFISTYIIAFVFSISAWLGFGFMLILYLGTVIGLGWAIGSIISIAARLISFVRTDIIKWIALISGFLAFFTYLGVFLVLDKTIGKELIIFNKYLELSAYFLIIPIFAWVKSRKEIQANPICYLCDKYMILLSLSGTPIKFESTLMEILNLRRFERLIELSNKVGNNVNHCGVTFWFCNNCRSNGFINATTTQTRIKKDKWEEKSQLIFSSSLKNAEIESLIAFFKSQLKDWEYD